MNGPHIDLDELVHGHFRPRHLSGVTQRAARDRHPQPVTAAASQVTTKPPRRRTRRDSAPTRENRHSRGERQAVQAVGQGLVRTQETEAYRSRAAHQFGDICGGAIDRAVVHRLLFRRGGETGNESVVGIRKEDNVVIRDSRRRHAASRYQYAIQFRYPHQCRPPPR